MKKQGNVLVIETKDLNEKLRIELQLYQFRYGNQIPEKIIVEQLPSATGKNRSLDGEYDVPIEYIYGADYYCPACRATHKLGGKVHQEHQGYRVVDNGE